MRCHRRAVFSALARCVCTALVMCFAATAHASIRYDPRLRFRTISTPRFDIHFHQGEDALAFRLASFIEDAASDVDAAVGAPLGRVQVILVDQHDLANGWATPIPYNTIEISVAPPTADSGVGNTDEWLRLVFVHEYTHIAHLSRAGGWIGGLRHAFGRYPLLFPNLYQPVWGIEGIATWQESVRTSGGRILAGDFRLLLNGAATANRFEPLDRANGGNVDWPSGTTPYVYGAYFHQFLADRYGSDSIRRLVDETSRRLPYLGSRAFKKVYGRSLGELWNEFAAATKASLRPAPESRATRLTHHGFFVSVPRIGPDGTVYYSAFDPHQFPALMTIAPDGTGQRQVATRYLGGGLGFAGDQVVVDEIELVRSVAAKSDLYLVDSRTGHRRRLTREARAADPDVTRDGRTIVCTVELTARRALATLSVSSAGRQATPELLISEQNVYFAGPRWSPDGRSIVAERRLDGGSADIVLVDVAARRSRLLASLPGGRAAAPAWMPDGSRVLFSAAVDDDPFRLYAVDVTTGVVTRLEGTGPSAQSAAISTDGRTLVYVGYTSEGYDLFSLPLADASWTSVSQVEPPPPTARQWPSQPSRSYSPWRSLAPRFWTPTVESDADEVVFGAAIGSADALGRHAYGVEAGWAHRGRPDWQVAYAYDRWRPTVFAAYADDTDPWRGGDVRTRELDAGLLLRTSRVRFATMQLAAMHVGDDLFSCATCAPAVDASDRRFSFRTGWEFTSAKTFGYSVSAEEGGRVTATAEFIRGSIRPEAGAPRADGVGTAVTVDGRHYWRAWPRHGAIALRGAAAAYWGDAEAERIFSASGNGPRPGGFGFGRDAIGLIRGFSEDSVAGPKAIVINVDYRAPLRRLDRGIGTVPLFVRSLHGAVFADGGQAWTDHARWDDLRASFGAEVSADTVVGFGLPLTFTAGGAWRHDGTGEERGFVVFGRVGRAF